MLRNVYGLPLLAGQHLGGLLLGEIPQLIFLSLDLLLFCIKSLLPGPPGLDS